jgi:hypothetical protein
MKQILKASSNERKLVFETAATKLQIPPEMIEKDFWVCWSLQRLFSDKELRKILRFKGGTSLSKVFNLIKRFSEDIDLILDWRCVTVENPLENRSNTKQDLFNKGIQFNSGAYISNSLYSLISNAMGDECLVSVDSEDPHVILINYPKTFSESYITPNIKLEIGPLAAWVPNDNFEISTYVGEAFPELNLPKINVPTILAERTFWEKVTILHQEHHRPEQIPVPLRYSRHYYDLFMMSKSSLISSFIDKKSLLESVVDFKKKFYPRNWARYDLAVAGSLRLLPAPHSEKALCNDYKAMENMIFGEYPSWNEIKEELADLENRINL